MMKLIKRWLKVKTLLFLALFYTVTISVLFFMPTSELPKVEVSGLDKIVHVVIHFILITLWLFYFYVKNGFKLKGRSILILFLSLLLFGIIVEILQGQLTTSRGADIFDITANLTGSLLGILFYKSIKMHLKT